MELFESTRQPRIEARRRSDCIIVFPPQKNSGGVRVAARKPRGRKIWGPSANRLPRHMSFDAQAEPVVVPRGERRGASPG